MDQGREEMRTTIQTGISLSFWTKKNLISQTMPEITDEYAESVSERYIELYEHITGEKFDKTAEEGDIAKRIEKNVSEYLATRK